MAGQDMTNLRKRPFQIFKSEDINQNNIENIFRHYDEQFTRVDSRRISQISTLAASATLADVIDKLNELIVALNGSDLTNAS